MKWQNLLYAVFAVALVAGGTSWFLQNFELKELPEYTGYKGEARENPLFAARLFLKRMGIPAERRDSLLDLPDTDGIILLNTERYSLSADKTAELLDWVDQGGHLITRARVEVENRIQAESASEERFDTEERDILQQSLGITLGEHQMPDEAELPVLFKPENSEETLGVELDFFNALLTRDDTAIQYTVGEHTWFINQPYGDGRISLLSTLSFFENHSLDTADHGKLLWYLVHNHRANPKELWLIHRDAMPSLFSLLVQHAGALLVTLTLLLVFIFWALIPRFGAMIPPPPPKRRRILDHIKASGKFLWRRQEKGQAQLCQTMQHSIRQLARQRIPGWQFLESEQQYAALANYLQQAGNSHSAYVYKPAELQHLLSARTLNEQNFTRLVQMAKRIRNAI